MLRGAGGKELTSGEMFFDMLIQLAESTFAEVKEALDEETKKPMCLFLNFKFW